MSEPTAYLLGELFVGVLVSIAFALTFRSFWRAQPRPLPRLAAWTYAAFSAVAIVVGATVVAVGGEFYAGYLAALFIGLVGVIAAHNWPKSSDVRSASVIGYATLVAVVVILLAAIAIAENGVPQVRETEARIIRLRRITEADVLQFSAQRTRGYGDAASSDSLARQQIPELEWMLAAPDLADVAAELQRARPGKELEVYRGLLVGAQRQRLVAQRTVNDALWSLCGVLSGISLLGVVIARGVVTGTNRLPTLRRRNVRPALVVGLAAIAGFLIAVGLHARAGNATLVGLGTGVLATAALVYRRVETHARP